MCFVSCFMIMYKCIFWQYSLYKPTMQSIGYNYVTLSLHSHGTSTTIMCKFFCWPCIARLCNESQSLSILIPTNCHALLLQLQLNTTAKFIVSIYLYFNTGFKRPIMQQIIQCALIVTVKQFKLLLMRLIKIILLVSE